LNWMEKSVSHSQTRLEISQQHFFEASQLILGWSLELESPSDVVLISREKGICKIERQTQYERFVSLRKFSLRERSKPETLMTSQSWKAVLDNREMRVKKILPRNSHLSQECLVSLTISVNLKGEIS
jgi:hypothetical protein